VLTNGTSKALNVSIPLGGQMFPISIVGAIVLTLQKKFTARTQQIFKQVLRRSNESIKIADLKIS
jgi:hypothetical protein